MKISFKQIGIIHTPYLNSATHQSVEITDGDFSIEIDPKYETALISLEQFTHPIDRTPLV